MHFVVQLTEGRAGRVEGTVLVEGHAQAKPFSGWLELLRLLEEGATTADAPA